MLRFVSLNHPLLFSLPSYLLHVVMDNPNDVQAAGFLQQAISILDAMAIVWPSAGRASELLVAAQLNVEEKRQRVSPRVTSSLNYSDPAQQKLFGSKRPPEDNSEQLQYQSQFAHRRGMSNSISHDAYDNQHIVPQSSTASNGQLHHRMSAPNLHILPDAAALQSRALPMSSDSIELGSRRIADDSHSYTDKVPNPGWDAPTGSSIPTYPSSHDFSTYAAPRASLTSSANFDTSTGYSTYPNHTHQLSAPSPMYPTDAPTRFEQQIQQRPHDHYPFQSPTPQPHNQSFWNDFANGGDPFGDPSKLSASLYNAPLLNETQRSQSYRPHVPSLSNDGSLDAPSGYPPAQRTLSTTPAFTPRFDYGEQ